MAKKFMVVFCNPHFLFRSSNEYDACKKFSSKYVILADVVFHRILQPLLSNMQAWCDSEHRGKGGPSMIQDDRLLRMVRRYEFPRKQSTLTGADDTK